MLSMSLLPCCRYHPAVIVQTYTNPGLVCLYCLRLQIAGFSFQNFSITRPPIAFTYACGLVTCSSPFMVTLSIDFRNLVTLLSAIQATGLLAFTLTGLSPAEHICLIWTHKLVRNFTTWGSQALLITKTSILESSLLFIFIL